MVGVVVVGDGVGDRTVNPALLTSAAGTSGNTSRGETVAVPKTDPALNGFAVGAALAALAIVAVAAVIASRRRGRALPSVP
jgi:hypothetical protein